MTVVPVSPPRREAVLALAPTAEQEPWSGAAVQTLPPAEADPRRHPFVILLRSPADADALTEVGVHVRLVKGAYVEASGAHPYGKATDVAYLRLGFRPAERGATWSMATHDGRIREAPLQGLRTVTVEQLLGVRPQVLDELQQRAVPTRVYVPYGRDWFRYWMRRLAESRGA